MLEGKIHLSDDEVVDTDGYYLALAEEQLEDQAERFAGKEIEPEDWDVPALVREVARLYGLEPSALEALDLANKDTTEIVDAVWVLIKASYEEKQQQVGAEMLKRVGRDVMLQSWTRSGRITSTRWTTSKKASACGATASGIRSSSTRRRASPSSRT